MRSRNWVTIALVALWVTGCEEEPSSSEDAGALPMNDAAGPEDRDAGGPEDRDAGGPEDRDGGGPDRPDAASTTMPPEAPTPPMAPTAPMAPTPAQPPDLSACPAGWREVSSSGGVPDPSLDYVTCEPYAGDDPATCLLGEAHFVGTPGCAPIGDPCVAGDEWPAGIDALSSVIYVNDTAVGVGLGNTRIGAFRTIGQAIERATPGTTIAVAKGTYDEVLTIPDGVTVLGACAAETRIQPTTGGDRTVLTEGVVRAAPASTGTLRNVSVVPGVTLVGVAAYGDRSLVIRGVAISAGFGVALYAQGAATLTADDVTVVDTLPDGAGMAGNALFVDGGTARIRRAMFLRSRDAGIDVFGGSADLEDVAVIGTQTRAADGLQGYGLVAQMGAQATISRCLFDSNDSVGVAAEDPMVRVVLRDSVVRRTETREGVVEGFGLYAGPSARVEVERSSFDRNQTAGIIAGGGGAEVSLVDVVVTRTLPLPDGGYGRGLDVELGAVVEVERALLDGNRDNGVFVSDAATSLTASDLTIVRTEPGQASRDGVAALHVRNGAAATITRATIVDNREGGVQVVDGGTSVSITDLSLRDNDSGPSAFGNGIDVDEGARLELTRASLTRSQHVGVFVNGTGAELVATDLVVSGTRPDAAGERGWGLRAQDGASVRVERAVIEGSTELGVFARDAETTVALTDAAITTTSAAADGTEGFGIVVFGGAELTVERGTVVESHDVGVLVSDSGSSVSLTDVRVARTLAAPDGTGGWGATAQDQASLTMTRVEIAESRDLGVLVVDADLTLVDVLVSNIAERACLESASCPSPASWESGMGVVSVNQSHILATSLQIESAARCGLLVSPSPVGSSGASAMSSGFTSSGIYRSAIGFCDQVEGLDPGVGLYLDGASNEVTTEQSTFAPATAISFL